MAGRAAGHSTSASLADLTWRDVESLAPRGVLAVPVGSTEQHGPHLPNSTDTVIAVALAERLTSALPGTIVAPAQAYGASGEHQGFPGTISIGQEALELIILELGRSASETFERTIFVSGHGGNAEPLARAARRLADEGRAVLAWSPSWRGDAHAGRTETSLMLCLRPELVQEDAAAAGNDAPFDRLWPALRSGGVRSVSSNGVLGNPCGASAEEGRRLLEEAAGELVAAVRAWLHSTGGGSRA